MGTTTTPTWRATYGLQNRNQTWTTDFGDLDNDGDLDAVCTNHNTTMEVFLNDGSGTTRTPLPAVGRVHGFLQSKLEDLDNDGYPDLITAGTGVLLPEEMATARSRASRTCCPNLVRIYPEPLLRAI